MPSERQMALEKLIDRTTERLRQEVGKPRLVFAPVPDPDARVWDAIKRNEPAEIAAALHVRRVMRGAA